GFRNKRGIVQAILEEALGRPCPYCQTVLTLENVGLDHKEPVNSSHRDRSKIPVAIRAHNDRPENLHMVCRMCNGSKGNFSDLEVRRLLAFSASEPSLGPKLMSRIKAACILLIRRRAA